MASSLTELATAGVSIWLDDLSRERIESGNLATLNETHHVVGVTTNPTIFANALAQGQRYQDSVNALVTQSYDVESIIDELTVKDVRDACELFADIYAQSGGVDGRVSIEVAPHLAHDTEGTIEAAARIWRAVDRPNALIKIPATEAGLPAIAATIAAGISVNVTLIFSVERYRQVMDAYLFGIEQAAAEGRDLSQIHSVASFFISRLDSAVDSQLVADSPLRGKAAVANAQLAFAAYEQVFDSDRARRLIAQGANVQRPLWASTGVKDPAYPDTKYVTELVAPGTVNTMPEATLVAMADHGEVAGDVVSGRSEDANEIFAALTTAGVDLPTLFAHLESDGVSKFNDSWSDLVTTVTAAMSKV